MLHNLTRITFNTFSSCSGAQPEILKSRGGFVELGHFGKSLSKTQEKKEGKILELFLLDLTYILNGKFNPRMETVRAFFSKSGHFFDFQKSAG